VDDGLLKGFLCLFQFLGSEDLIGDIDAKRIDGVQFPPRIEKRPVLPPLVP
jgi:hypothetical protein